MYPKNLFAIISQAFWSGFVTGVIALLAAAAYLDLI